MTSTPPPPEPYNPPPATRAEAAQSGYTAPQAGYSAPPAAYGAPAARPKGSSRLGLIAFVAALVGIIIGSILATIGGMQTGGLTQYADYSTGTGTLDYDSVPPSVQQMGIAAGLLTIAAFLVWGAFALWGFIQGIVATVKNRGRGWGIAAIVLAVIGGGIVLIFLTVGVGVGAAPYIS
ncbi:hypothetical protein [Microbacterium sp. T32]|uniref:hypothetical protein n=1 Tax=Microbacterium sp. T32 TaxID=1776083 RepID=UPI0007AB8601|nr:hypothetical protein [Microbacterium sp. T32]KZE41205.1 hypothetical protein AVW09_00980 [Microbacterium sp. T32]